MKSTVYPDPNARLVCVSHMCLNFVRAVDKHDQQGAGFAIGDECEMDVQTMCADGRLRFQPKKFLIRNVRNVYGKWRYQLNDAETGQPFEGETWFDEEKLGEAQDE